MESNGTAALVRFRGEIDIADSAWLSHLAELTEPTDTVIVDVNGLRYADTTFLRFLLTLKRSPNRRALNAVRLVRAGRNVRRVLQVTGMKSLFAYYDALGEATRDFAIVRTLTPRSAVTEYCALAAEGPAHGPSVNHASLLMSRR